MKRAEIIGWQFVGTLNSHFHSGYTDSDGRHLPPNEDDHCCPVCCGPCSALSAAIEDPQMLAEIATWIVCTRYNEGGWTFWNGETFSLDVDLIRAGWRRDDGSLYCVNGDELHDQLMREKAMAEILDEGNRRLKESLYGKEGR